MRMNGSPMIASSAATTRSQSIEMYIPPAMAWPWICAMITLGLSQIAS